MPPRVRQLRFRIGSIKLDVNLIRSITAIFRLFETEPGNAMVSAEIIQAQIRMAKFQVELGLSFPIQTSGQGQPRSTEK